MISSVDEIPKHWIAKIDEHVNKILERYPNTVWIGLCGSRLKHLKENADWDYAVSPHIRFFSKEVDLVPWSLIIRKLKIYDKFGGGKLYLDNGNS